MRSQELNCQTGHEDKSDKNKNSSGADLDFLSRERELLGDNAAEFATPNDTMASATVDDGIDDFFIGGGNQQSSSGNEFFAFESSFPSIDAVRKSPRCALNLWRYILLPDSLIMKTQEPPGSTITSLPPTTSQTAPSPSFQSKPDEEETEPIRCVIHSPLLPTPNSSSPFPIKLFHNSLSTIFSPSKSQTSITDNGAYAETKKSSSAPNYPPRKKKPQSHQPRNGRTTSTKAITGKRTNPLRGPARRPKPMLLVARILLLAVPLGNGWRNSSIWAGRALGEGLRVRAKRSLGNSC